MLKELIQPTLEPQRLAPESKPCRLEVLHSFEEAEEIREQWNDLAARVDADLFASFDWCAVWWRHFSRNRSLRICTFWVGDKLTALLPLFRETIGWGPLRLKVIRMVGSDHAGTRCWPLFETRWLRQALALIFSELDREGPWDLFHMGDLPGYFPEMETLIAALRDTSPGHVRASRNYYPQAVFPIPGDFETYLKGLSGNERNNIRKNERRLSKTQALRGSLATEEECEAYLDEFFLWHDVYWNGQNELGFFSLWPGAREFHCDFARTPDRDSQSVFLRVYADHSPVGTVYAYRFRHRLHLFQAVRAPGDEWESYGPGRLIHCEAFRWCMEQGVDVVDGMSGFYEYKRRLGAEFPGLTTLSVVHPSLQSRLRAKFLRWLVLGVNALYFRLWLRRVVPYLRRQPGLRERRWLRAGMATRFVRSRFLIAAFQHSKNDGPAVEAEGAE